MVLAYRAHRHNEIALHARMTSPPAELVKRYLRVLQEATAKITARAVINFRYRAKGKLPRSLAGEESLCDYGSISLSLLRPRPFFALLSPTKLFARRATIDYPVSLFRAVRIAFVNSYKIRTLFSPSECDTRTHSVLSIIWIYFYCDSSFESSSFHARSLHRRR